MSFHFTIDNVQTASANEYYRDAKRLKLSSGIFAGLLLIGAVLIATLLGNSPWVYASAIVVLALAIIYIGVTFQISKQIKAPQDLYDSSPLAPAMIAEVNERTMTLMSLVDTRIDASVGKPRPALTIRTVSAISGAPRLVGARIPAVAVGGVHKKNIEFYDQVTPVPIAWSTRDKKVIARAEASINNKKWELLHQNLNRVDDVRSTKRDLLPL